MTPVLHGAAVVLLAVALDRALGDPPNRLHPVAWMGRALAAGRRGLCRGPAWWLLLSGGGLVLVVMGLAVAAGVLVERLATALGAAGVVVEVAALKTTIAPRGLAHAARAVAEPLARGALDEARAALGLHLVSRPTAALAAGQVASGAVESVAENLTDALVGPLLCFLLWGVPGALAYRALNTADTMLGYREGPLEHFGKAAARLDDVANLIPAWLAALALVVAAGPHAREAWTVMARDHGRTASPNAGWTMAAMAGALGVTLEKPGAYRLGHGPMPQPEHVGLSLRVFWRACGLTVAAVVVAGWLIEKLTR